MINADLRRLPWWACYLILLKKKEEMLVREQLFTGVITQVITGHLIKFFLYLVEVDHWN